MRRPLSVIGASLVALLAMAALVAWPVPSKAAELCGPQPGQTADAKVILKNIAYSPQTVTLPVAGQTVCWEHQDGQIAHSITSDAAPGATDYFDFPGAQCTPAGGPDCFQQGDQPWKLMLNSGGTFKYHCKIHPSMTGTIVVAGGSPGTSATSPTTSTTRPAAGTSTTRAGATATTVGTLTEDTTTPSIEEATTSSSSSTSSTIATTSTTSSDSALDTSDDDDDASGVLKAVGAVLLLAVIAALIPAWRRLT